MNGLVSDFEMNVVLRRLKPADHSADLLPALETLEGKIVRKKKRRHWLVLSIRASDSEYGCSGSGSSHNHGRDDHAQFPKDKSVTVWLPRSGLDQGARDDAANAQHHDFVTSTMIYLNSTIRVSIAPYRRENGHDSHEAFDELRLLQTNDGKGSSFGSRLDESCQEVWIAQQVELISCAPDPVAVASCLPYVLQGKLPFQVFQLDSSGDISPPPLPLFIVESIASETKGAKDVETRRLNEQIIHQWLQCMSASHQPNVGYRRRAVAAMVRHLEQRATIRQPSKRTPHVYPRELAILHCMEQEVMQMRKITGGAREPDPLRLPVSPEPVLLCPQNVPLNLPTALNRGESNSSLSAVATSLSASCLIKNSAANFDEAAEAAERKPDGHVSGATSCSTILSRRGTSTRQEYLFQKKHPQIEWMIRRLRELRSSGDPFGHVLDVGGGRGDLAVAIAIAFEDIHVTVVDKNYASLQAAKAYSEACQCITRMTFICEDFHEFFKSHSVSRETRDPALDNGSTSPLPVIDCVVALHTCGDLSDCALEFASKRKLPFLVCPCCYSKRYLDAFQPPWYRYCTVVDQMPLSQLRKIGADLAGLPFKELSLPKDESRSDEGDASGILTNAEKTLCRLAEVEDRSDVARRARRVINLLRLQCVYQANCENDCTVQRESGHPLLGQAKDCCDDVSRCSFQVSLEEYDEAFSRRNMCLVGRFHS
jgi:Methyltransferase domain